MAAIKKQATGISVKEICREVGISEPVRNLITYRVTNSKVNSPGFTILVPHPRNNS